MSNANESEVLAAVHAELVVLTKISACPRVPNFGELRGDIATGGSTSISRAFYHYFNKDAAPTTIASAIASGLRNAA